MASAPAASASSTDSMPTSAAERPYQPAFMESMTLPREQRTGYSPLDNPQFMAPKEKLRLFIREQPLIPLGLTATLGFFVYGLGHFVRGKAPANNWKFQAGRVGAQGLTLLAMAYYGWFGPMKKRKTLRKRIP